MSRQRLPARRLAPACLAAWAALNLAACDTEKAIAPVAAQAAAVDPPQLWRAEALDRDGRVQKAVMVCVDSVLRQGLARANAEVNGEPCVAEGPLVSRPGQYALRCTAGGRRFALWTRSWGDPQNDLTVSFAANALDSSHQSVTQLRRYRRQGACPAGWRVGDQGPA
jgi:hypothetical protein